MTRAETLKLMAVLTAAYPNRELPQETVELYCQFLADLPYPETEAAVKRHIMTNQWFPTIAEIRKAVVELTCDAPSAGEAWQEVWQALSRYGQAGYFGWSHPLVRAAVQALGYENLYFSENPAADRARFMEIYEDLRNRYVARMQMGELPFRPMLRALPGKKEA